MINSRTYGAFYRLSTAILKNLRPRFELHQINCKVKFHSAMVYNGNANSLRDAAFLKKMMDKINSRLPTNIPATMSANAPLKDFSRGKTNPRRQKVLNNLLLRHISDLLSSGEVDPSILGKGIEITRVVVSNDVNRAEVYWFCSSDVNGDEIQKILDAGAGTLRQMLSHLYIMGHIPILTFSKDPYQQHVLDIERTLSTADMGSDFTRPVAYDVIEKFNSASVNTTKEKRSEKTTEEPQEVRSNPKLRTNIYGLDRETLLRNLRERTKKTNFLAKEEENVYSHPITNQVQLDSKSSLEKMTNFIKEQKRLKGSMLKQAPAVETNFEAENRYDSSEIYESDDEDYFEDDDNQK